MGTANVLELSRRYAVRRVVIASSTTVGYAGFGRHGITEIEEDLSLHMLSERPASIYAMTKVACEQLALLYSDLYGLDVIVLRYGAVMGGDLAAPTSVPGQLLAQLAQAPPTDNPVPVDDPVLLWNGTEEFVDARDCARANLCALDSERPPQRVYNIATGVTVSMPEFLTAAEKVFPGLKTVLPPLPETGFAGFPYTRPAPSSTAAARREIGFSCQYTLEDSLRYWGASARHSAKAGDPAQPKGG
jgi:UDP-glucose 4-epimerase